MLHIHLSEEALLSYHNGKLGIAGGVGRLEGVGPITLGQVRRFLRDTGCDVTVQLVIDPQNVPAVDSYEISRRIREAIFLRMPASCFPYATATQRMDLDHTIRYRPPARRTAGANRRRHARPTDPLRTSRQNTWPMASTPTRTRSLDLAITPQCPLIWSAMLAPTTWAMDASRAEFGAPRYRQTSRHHKLNK
jgi:hypothetical protein